MADKSVEELKEEIEEIMSTPEGRMRLGTLLRANFRQYVTVIFLFCFDAKYIFQPFHEEIIRALQGIADCENKKRNLMLNLPFGAGKSILFELFITWTFARNKNINYCYVSHSLKLITNLSKETRDIIQSNLYYKLFNLKLKQNDKSKINYSFEGANKRSGLMAGTLSSGITGADAGNPNVRGYPGALIIDDAADAESVKSQTERANVIYIYTTKLKTRRRGCKIPTLMIAQRLHKEDLCSYVEEHEKDEFDIIKIKALDDNDRSYWQERYPAQDFIKMRDNPTTYSMFMAQCQQEPVESENQVINVGWFGSYEFSNLSNIKFKRTFIIADTAMKVKEANDFSVFLVCGLSIDGRLYILDMIRGKWESPDLLKEAKKVYSKWNTAFNYRRLGGMYIEDKASGIGLIQQMKQIGLPITAINTKRKDKLERLEDILPYIYDGKVYLPSDRPFSKEIIRECMEFQRDLKHKHDDIVDTLVYSCMVAFTGAASSIFNGMCG
jgi:predicted phage terminase large subunit-like protein